MTDELKPCPFCGNTNIAFNFETFGNGMRMVTSFCSACHPATIAEARGVGDTEEEAIEQAVDNWNTRAERTCRPTPMYNTIFECDVCGEIDADGVPNYCPGCGAKVLQ